jgi:hypothetical protein
VVAGSEDRSWHGRLVTEHYGVYSAVDWQQSQSVARMDMTVDLYRWQLLGELASEYCKE